MHTVFPKSLNPFYTVTWAKTSWTYSIMITDETELCRFGSVSPGKICSIRDPDLGRQSGRHGDVLQLGKELGEDEEGDILQCAHTSFIIVVVHRGATHSTPIILPTDTFMQIRWVT